MRGPEGGTSVLHRPCAPQRVAKAFGNLELTGSGLLMKTNERVHGQDSQARQQQDIRAGLNVDAGATGGTGQG